MKSKSFKFFKNKFNEWYIDLPEWKGEQWELEMVAGADDFLEIVAQGNDEAFIQMSLEPFVLFTEPIETNAFTLIKTKDTPDIGGANYLLTEWYGTKYNLELWLCHVTEFVFGKMPDVIYIG